jgi:hypothetical protein
MQNEMRKGSVCVVDDPLPDFLVVFFSLVFELVGDVRHKGVVGLRLRHQVSDTLQ